MVSQQNPLIDVTPYTSARGKSSRRPRKDAAGTPNTPMFDDTSGLLVSNPSSNIRIAWSYRSFNNAQHTVV